MNIYVFNNGVGCGYEGDKKLFVKTMEEANYFMGIVELLIKQRSDIPQLTTKTSKTYYVNKNIPKKLIISKKKLYGNLEALGNYWRD